MSRGALLQLIAKGEMDKYLYDNNIENTLFKKSFKKITNFAEAHISQYPISSSTWGNTITFKIDRYGDLLSNMYLVLKIPQISVTDIIGKSENPRTSEYRVKWKDYLGNLLIDTIKFKIGGQTIDEQTGEYIQFYTDLYDTTWSKLCMIGHDESMIIPSTKINEQYLYIPLKFWFCNDIENALPIIGLQYHEIEVEIKLKNWDDLYHVVKKVTNEISISESETSKNNFEHTTEKLTKKHFDDLRLDCNFIYLDIEERKIMAEEKLEYLITQTQYIKTSCKPIDSINLNFNHPVKEIFFVIQNKDIFNLGEIFNYSGKSKYLPVNISTITESLWDQIPNKHLLSSASLELNGVDRVVKKDYKFWHYVQNYEHYRNTVLHNIYMFSFGLSNSFSSGSCNFSRINNAELKINLIDNTNEFIHHDDDSKIVSIGPGTNSQISIYANNYNILVINGGMGGLMFSS